MAALMFMAIVIPVAIEGLRIASRAGVAAERKGVATRLADSRLNELIVTGQWKNAGAGGNFGDRWPGYRWTARNEMWTNQVVHLVTVEVSYPVQNQDFNVRLSTLVVDSPQ